MSKECIDVQRGIRMLPRQFSEKSSRIQVVPTPTQTPKLRTHSRAYRRARCGIPNELFRAGIFGITCQPDGVLRSEHQLHLITPSLMIFLLHQSLKGTILYRTSIIIALRGGCINVLVACRNYYGLLRLVELRWVGNGGRWCERLVGLVGTNW